MLGQEVFLKGKYIELGVHTVGSFGTAYVCAVGGVWGKVTVSPSLES
jgi:hypothetical protein